VTTAQSGPPDAAAGETTRVNRNIHVGPNSRVDDVPTRLPGAPDESYHSCLGHSHGHNLQTGLRRELAVPASRRPFSSRRESLWTECTIQKFDKSLTRLFQRWREVPDSADDRRPGFFQVTKHKWASEPATLNAGTEICKLRRVTIRMPPPGTEMNVSVNGKFFLAFRQPGKSNDVATSPDLTTIYDTAGAVVQAFANL
jgi:hypothetical protein